MQNLKQIWSGHRKEWLITAVVVMVFLVGFRLALPSILLHYANQTLYKIEVI